MAAVLAAAGIAGVGTGAAAAAGEHAIAYPAQDDGYGYPSQDGYDDYYDYPPPTDYYPPTSEAPSPSPSPEMPVLPETGSSSLVALALGMGLIALGLVAWLLTARRRARV